MAGGEEGQLPVEEGREGIEGEEREGREKMKKKNLPW